MRLVNYEGRLGLDRGGRFVDLEEQSGGRLPSDPMEAFGAWDEIRRFAEDQAKADAGPVNVPARLGAPVPRPTKVVAIGLNYKDQPDAAVRWLQNFGDPYDRIGSDLNGRVGIDFGVYGVPETFVLDRHGVIRYKQVGPVSREILDDVILPLIAELGGES